MSSYYRSYQYANIPSIHNSSHGSDGQTQSDNNPWPNRVESQTSESSVMDRGRRNPYMIASVVIIFFLLLFTHHRQTPNSMSNINSNNRGKSQGISGDTGVTTSVTHTPFHDNTIGTTPGDKTLITSTSSSSSSSNSYHTHVATPKPKLTYLLTYPSSGSSFLIHLFQTWTNTNTASMIGSYYPSYQVDTSTTTNAKTVSSPTYKQVYQPPISIYTTNMSAASLSSSTNINNSGPFWVMDPRSSSSSSSTTSSSSAHAALPTQFILTETHCSGICSESPCLSSEYIQSIYTFEQACRALYIKDSPSTIMIERNNNIPTTRYHRHRTLQSQEGTATTSIGGDTVQQIGILDPFLITRAIHLIRDPFSNIVSRFHASRRSHINTNNNQEMNGTTMSSTTTTTTNYNINNNLGTGNSNTTLSKDLWIANHPDTIDGLHNWCQEMNTDAPFQDIITQGNWNLYFPSSWETISRFMQNIPCSLEIFKYVMWHNHAVELSTMYFNSSTYYIVYFEELENNQNRIQILKEMTSFLNMTSGTFSSSSSKSNVNKVVGAGEVIMENRVWYGDRFFSQDEKKDMELLIRKLAFPKTLALLERYFLI